MMIGPTALRPFPSWGEVISEDVVQTLSPKNGKPLAFMVVSMQRREPEPGKEAASRSVL